MGNLSQPDSKFVTNEQWLALILEVKDERTWTVIYPQEKGGAVRVIRPHPSEQRILITEHGEIIE